MGHWIYLSPHFDDVALSCGGLIWEQVATGARVEIWTICAGTPDNLPLSPFAASLHDRWQSGESPVEVRRLEDLAACQHLGAQPRYFSIPDCIYRRDNGNYLYPSEESLFGPLHPADADLIARLVEDIRTLLPAGANLVSPLGLGDHVDHKLTRQAAEVLDVPLWYYADYPYVLSAMEQASLPQNARRSMFRLSQPALLAWQDAVAAYASQISTFWRDESSMRYALQDYASGQGGVWLWNDS
jgi:LmbE family N-acetylglucosaminyl deacetylase